MAMFTDYDIVGKKEDVSNVISNISPTKTPFQTSIGSDKVTNTVFQWQEDSLAAVNLNNAQVTGFTASDATLTPTTMRDNVTQILQKTIKVAGTTDAVSTYGRAKESAYQLAKAAAELKRDLEGILLSGQTKVVGDNATARKMAAVQAQIDASVTVTTDSDTGTGGNQAGPITEANILKLAQAVYDAGGETPVIQIKPADSLLFAQFSGASGRYRTIDGGSKTVVNAVNLYVSPFGEHKVVLNRFQKATDALMYDPSMWQLAVLRNWFRETLAKDGDNLKMMIVGEFSLKHKNYKASGLLTNLS